MPASSPDSKSELEKVFQKVRRRPATVAHDDADETSNGGETEKVSSDVREAEDTAPSPTTIATSLVDNEVTADGIVRSTPNGATNGHQRESSPIPDIDTVDNADLDNVNLDDDAATASSKRPPPVPPRDTSSKSLSLSSFASVIPSIPWSPSSTAEPAKPPPISPSIPPLGAPVTGPTRKLTGPFAWLSRASSKEAIIPSPPAQVSPPATSPRRNTASSVATLTSNPEMMLSKLEEETDPRRGTGRSSLKDRFKMIRLREEANSGGKVGEEEKAAAHAGVDSTGGSPKAATIGLSIPGAASSDEQIPASPMPSSPNPSLAPGTVSGVTAGPSSISDDAVDWDLWQSVIYEGPAAVARTSAEELNKAIATGIPSAIRGVVWQVVAQSKNEEFEVVYHDLLARGTERQKERQSSGSAGGVKESASSSA